MFFFLELARYERKDVYVSCIKCRTVIITNNRMQYVAHGLCPMVHATLCGMVFLFCITNDVGLVVLEVNFKPDMIFYIY